ncbi:hypothetical protein RJ640_021101 [Escallonia rubra]|uniref:C2 NT-type domain-containing protein n=1 Tax=Escallonia rubra TaxID=112253 RepID=A0AA88UBF6_9ASTE|nr:hypothetical protein RJ640_021101 [Escallonia rubra]
MVLDVSDCNGGGGVVFNGGGAAIMLTAMVPKGWDKLSVTLISAETGKTVCKSKKASVHSGNCQWTEDFSESIWISQDDVSQGRDQCIFKLLVAMIKIQCITPKTKLSISEVNFSNGKWNGTNSYKEDGNVDYDDMDNKSDASDSSVTKSVGSSSSNRVCGPGEPGSRETSFSVSGSRPSFGSMEDSLGRESVSPRSTLSGVANNATGRQESIDSATSASYGSYPPGGSPTSNNSPYNLQISGYGRHLQNQREDLGQLSRGASTSPLLNAGSSKAFREADELTIEELRAEARMWERNARKLMIDQETLRKDFDNQEKHLVNMDMELSTSQAECSGLKQEIDHLKICLKESMAKQEAIENLKLQAQEKDSLQKELEEEIRFQSASNNSLLLQLTKTQESNLELVSVLQEMEDTIEKQKMEIENLLKLNLNSNNLGMDDGEVNPNAQVSAEKMKVASLHLNLEGIDYQVADLHAQVEDKTKSTSQFQLQQLRESKENLETTDLYPEKTLEDNNNETDLDRDLRDQTLLDCKAEWRHELTLKEEEVANLRKKLSKALNSRQPVLTKSESGGDLDQINEIRSLKEKVMELERDCNELTEENLELWLTLKESRKDLSTCDASFNSLNEGQVDDSPSTSESKVGELEAQIGKLKEEMKQKEILLERVAADDLQTRCNDLESKCTHLESQLQAFNDKACSLDLELQKYVAKAQEQETEISALQKRLECQQEDGNSTIHEEKTRAVVDKSVQMNKSTNKDFYTHEVLRYDEEEIRMRVTNSYENDILCAVCQGLKNLNKELESRVEYLGNELLTKTSDIGELKSDCLQKEEEIEALRCSQRGLETQMSDLEMRKRQMEENMEIMQRQETANMVLERKLLELESCKKELELNLSELEEENVHLSERISGLEAQLRYLTDARESSRLEVQQSESHAMNLQDNIRRLQNEMEVQKVDMRQKIQEMHNRWLEAQEECEYLKNANPKLQATAESLIEECSSLQKSNRELRQQRSELHKHRTVLEAELKETQSSFSACSKQVEALEARFSALLSEISSKEKLLDSELDSLKLQHDEHKEKLVLGESLLNQMYLGKTAEVEKLQQEVAYLSSQIYATNDERERKASEAVLEMHTLRADNDKLEAALQEVQREVEMSHKKLGIVQMECENKVLEVVNELSASNQKNEVSVSNNEKIMGLLKAARSNEDILKGIVDELEAKLKSSEFEKLDLAEEISGLETQLQKLPLLQDEVLTLKSSLNEMKFENERLEASLHLIHGDCEELKAEKISLLEKISSMQNAASESENFRHSKVALEEKILRLEGDLTAREASCTQDAEIKNELGRTKRANSQLLWKIKCVEEEKEECMKKFQVLDEELKQKKGVEQDQTKPATNNLPIPGLHDASTMQRETDLSKTQKLDKNSSISQEIATDTASRIQSLENELAEASEANDMYKAQLKRPAKHNPQYRAPR